MSVAATATTDYSVDQILRLAMVTAGVLNPKHFNSSHVEAQLAAGRMQLFVVLQALQNDGVILRARERASLSLTASQAYVDAPSDTISIEKGAVTRSTEGTDIELTLYSIDQWQVLPDKTIEGKPNFYYPEKLSATETWRIHLYPVPTSDWPTLIVPRTRRLRDVENGTVNLDLHPKHYLHVLNTMAAWFARGSGRRDLALELGAEAVAERDRAEADETERGDTMFVASRTPWDY